MSAPNPTLSNILRHLPDEGGSSVLDIGCGAGQLSRALTKRGFRVTGVDPNAAAIDKAQLTCPDANFVVAGAEALPFGTGTFDGAVFLNSLHHVPEARMSAALAEVIRCLRPGGPLIVIEPVAEGTFFETMRPVEDETEIRKSAQDALDWLDRTEVVERLTHVRYDRDTRFADLGEFFDTLLASNPARAAAVKPAEAKVERLFRLNARQEADGYFLSQPLDLRVFRKL